MKRRNGGPLNILYISPEASFTGAPLSLLSLAARLDRERFNPLLLFLKEGPLLNKVKEKGLSPEVLGRPYIPGLFQFLKKRDIDLLHINTVVPQFAAPVARMSGLPLIWHIREDLSRGIWNKFLVKTVESLADRIIVNSRYTGSVFKRKGKVTTVYNGVDLDRFHPGVKGEEVRKELNISRETPIVGTIGNFTPAKGYLYLLEAAREIIRELPRVKFLVLGSIHPLYKRYYERMREEVKKLGISDSLILMKGERDVPRILASFDLFLLPSVQETLGRVVIEAMACGKPVVATRIGGIPEVVEEKVTGYLVPSRDPHSLARRTRELLLDKEKASAMGKEGRKRVERLFNVNKMVEETKQVYKSLLDV